MRSIKAILAVAAAVALMALSAVPALANDWNDDGYWGHNSRWGNDGFLGYWDGDFGDCGWSCRHDDFFGFSDCDRDKPHQRLDVQTGKFYWTWC